MLGAIVGNFIGVPYEFTNNRDKDFDFIVPTMQDHFMDDDTLLTLATAQCVLDKMNYNTTYSFFARQYPHLPYGRKFGKWIYSIDMEPYNSLGNGSAMRVSPIGFYYKDRAECLSEAYKSSFCTHNHPQALQAACFTADVGYRLKNEGLTTEEFESLCDDYDYPHHQSIDDMRATYQYSEWAEPTIHAAIVCFKSATDFEDAIRNACSVGGDADTIAAIVGGWAESKWGVPSDLENMVMPLLPSFARKILEDLYQ